MTLVCVEASKGEAFPLFVATNIEAPQDPHTVDFDKGAFDVLADNCANRTISPFKEDFVNLQPLEASISGVGSASAQGIGTVTWTVVKDDGDLLEIVDDEALYVPGIKYRILSVTRWGKQRTERRKDGRLDQARVVTTPDSDESVLYCNRDHDQVTITHTNDLPKMRCRNATDETFDSFSADARYENYHNVCRPCNTREKLENFYFEVEVLKTAAEIQPPRLKIVSPTRLRENEGDEGAYG